MSASIIGVQVKLVLVVAVFWSTSHKGIIIKNSLSHCSGEDYLPNFYIQTDQAKTTGQNYTAIYSNQVLIGFATCPYLSKPKSV